jgi:hypothetical protein
MHKIELNGRQFTVSTAELQAIRAKGLKPVFVL